MAETVSHVCMMNEVIERCEPLQLPKYISTVVEQVIS